MLAFIFILLTIGDIFADNRKLIMMKTKQREDEVEEAVPKEVFKPSKDWQKVEKGQPIPAGLHVRMNIQTGEVEAKFLDEESSDNSAVAEVPSDEEDSGLMRSQKEVDGIHMFEADDGSRSIFSGGKYNREELEQAMKNIQGDQVEMTDEDLERVNKKYRSYTDLKKEFKDLKMAVKTDMELISELILKYRSATDYDKVSILIDLEYLVHQFDNAQDFVKSKGLSDIVFPGLNASSDSVRSGSAHLLGSAMQSNPKVQIAALEKGAVHHLLRILAFDPEMVVRSRALYAISCLVRHFPIAQQKFIEEGGLSVFADVFQKGGQEYLKLQLKVVTLLHDLFLEKQHAKQHVKEHMDAVQIEKLRQYNLIGLEQHILEQGWCDRFPRLLFAPVTDKQANRDDLSAAVSRGVPIRPEHDVIEKVLNAMLTFSDLCQVQFGVAGDVLQELEQRYKELSMKEELERKSENVSDNSETDFFYYTSMSELVTNVQKKVKVQKDEL